MDDTYQTFIWSTIVLQPTVRVGKAPTGRSTDVYIPAQPRVGKRAKNSKQDGAAEEEAVKLEIIPDGRTLPLQELVDKHGNSLRVAVDTETCYVALTGSHARVRLEFSCTSL